MITTRVREWLTVDMIVFLLLFIGIAIYAADRLPLLTTINYFELLLLGLATYRLANIISTENVTKPLRAPFVDEVQKDGKIVEQPKRDGFLGATGLLLHCPSCTGVWAAAALIYGYLLWPFPTFLLAVILALSGVERIITHFLNLVRRT